MTALSLARKIADRWRDAQPISETPSDEEIAKMIDEETGTHCANETQMTREDLYRREALDMALRRAETHPDVGQREPEKVTKTAELFRRFLSGEPWPTM